MLRSSQFPYIVSLVALLGAAPVAAEEDTGHLMVTSREITWVDAPPNLPAGARLALLYGDPGGDGLFVLRLWLPAGYRVPAHWHPTDENVTVLSGALLMGMGDHFDADELRPYCTGSFLSMPAGSPHFAATRAPTIVEVSGIGPFATTYVDPNDDPSQQP